jgi:SAM-dependent methyltransferase
MTLPAEEHFPAIYHSHHIRHLEDIPYWSRLAKAQGGPVLELGCGTGRVLVSLARAGYQTYGLDNDLDMLSYLQENLPPDLKPPPRIFQADMSAFRLAARFRLIFLPCNTLSTLTEQARKSTFSNAVRHMDKEGLFSFSIPNPSLLTRLPEQGESELEELFEYPGDGEPVQVSSAWVRNSELFRLRWYYDHLLPDGKVNRHTVQVKHWIVPPQTYIDEMQTLGLKVVEWYGDFDLSPYTNRSPSLILTAIRMK